LKLKHKKLRDFFNNFPTTSHSEFQPTGWQVFRDLTLRCRDTETSSDDKMNEKTRNAEKITGRNNLQ